MSLIHVWKGHMSNSVHHIKNGVIIHITNYLIYIEIISI